MVSLIEPQLEGVIDSTTQGFSNGQFHTEVPSWGRLALASNITGDLKGGIHVPISIGTAVTGTINLQTDASSSNLVVDYDLDLQWAGKLADKITLFPIPAWVLSLASW